MPRVKTPGVPDAEQLLRQEIAAQDSARRLRNFVVLGRAYSMTTPKGVIQFSKQMGPGLAQETVEGEPGPRLLLVSNWPELPDQKGYSEEFCKACLAECTACGGKGKQICMFTGCGGTGRVKTGEAPCPMCVAKVGHFKPDCKTCGGYGAIAEMGDCPCCHGEKVADCGACRGTGKRPTGFAGGAREGELCKTCRGSMRDGRWKHQDLAQFIAGRLGDYLAVGPILSITAEPVEIIGGSRFGSRFSPEDVSAVGSREMIRLAVPPDEHGTPLLLLLPMTDGKVAVPCPGYFFGGAKFA